MDPSDDKRLSLIEFLKSTWWVVRIYWKICPDFLVILCFTTVLSEIEIFISSYIQAWILDYIVTLSQGGAVTFELILPIALVFFGVRFASNVVSQVDAYVNNQIQFITDPK